MYLYNLLKAKQNSSNEELKKSYRKLAKLFHPDMNDEVGSEVKFISIKKTYDILIDANLRTKYDASLNITSNEASLIVQEQIKEKYFEAYKLDLLLSIDLRKNVNYNRQSVIVSFIYDYCIMENISENSIINYIEGFENELVMSNSYKQNDLKEVKPNFIKDRKNTIKGNKFKYATYLFIVLATVIIAMYIGQNFLNKPDNQINDEPMTIMQVSYPTQIEGVYVVNGGSSIYTWKFRNDGNIDTEIYFPKTGEKIVGKADWTYTHVKNDLFYIYESGTFANKARISNGKFFLIDRSVSDDEALEYTDEYPGLLQK